MDSLNGPGTALPANRRAVLSIVLAAITLLFVCIGFAPIPLTALVCYPAALAGSIASIGSGGRALREIREKGEKGRSLALIAVWVGALTIVAVFISVAITMLVFSNLVDYIRQNWIPSPIP